MCILGSSYQHIAMWLYMQELYLVGEEVQVMSVEESLARNGVARMSINEVSLDGKASS